MDNGSSFLNALIGKPIQIVAIDQTNLPPLILREVSTLGVVAEDSRRAHFYPWNEIVEIFPYAEEQEEELSAALAFDSEP